MSEEQIQPVSNIPVEPEGKSISEYVKPEVVNQLIEMGFSKNVSEKACFFNQSNLENSVNWIYEHQQDPDFEEELRIVGEGETQKLTPEEIKEKAKNLQELARKRFMQKQKDLEEEQERNRIRMTRDLMKAKQDKEDAEMKRYIEQRNREKKEAELEKKKMLEQLARDKEERFGKKFDPSTQGVNKQYSAYDDAVHYLKAIKVLYPTFRAGDTCKNAYSTIKVILANILKNKNEEKYRKVKQTNPNFHERVGKLEAAMKVLSSLSFIEDGEFLICSSPDFGTFEKVVAFLEEEINKLD